MNQASETTQVNSSRLEAEIQGLLPCLMEWISEWRDH